MNVEKLQMCRICLVEDVRMFMVTNKELQQLFEKLTDIPFVTEDSRPMLTCVFCYTKLKQCCQLQRKCLEAEKLFTQMLNEDDETKPGISGYNIITPTVHVNCVLDECQSEIDDIKEELKDDCEEENENFELYEEHHDIKEELKDDCEEENENFELYEEHHDIKEELKDDCEEENENFELYEEHHDIKEELKGDCEEENESIEPKQEHQSDLEQEYQEREYPENCTDLEATPSKFIKRFTNSHSISNIMNNTDTAVNDRIKTYDCDVCHRSCTKKRDLIRHIRIHTGEKRFKCEICQKNFSRNDCLKSHVRMHTGEKPFKCERCQKSFSTRGNLKTHVRIHTGDKPYKCELCQKSFNVRSNLISHVRIHIGEKPYKCEICQKSFSRSNYLKTHVRIHTGEKP